MGAEVRYGIVGTGLMGLEHIRNLALIPEARVTAIADTEAASRERGAAAVGGEVDVFTDCRDLVRRGAVDAIVIATPNFTHARLLDEVFASDRHVLVEKPLCTTLEDCRRVQEAARAHRGVVQVGMEYRYMPAVARLIDEVRRGAIGRLRMLAIREHRFPFLPKVRDWNRFARFTGGTLVEKCCHFFDLMNLIVRERPVRVYASGAQDVNHLDEVYGGEAPDVLDNAFVIVDYADGTRACLDLCMFADGSRHEQEIAATGDRGKIECFIPESSVVLAERKTRRVHVESIPVDPALLEAGHHQGATYYEHLAFLDAIRSRRAPDVSVDDGLAAVALGVAAERSALEHRPFEGAELGI